MFVEERDYTVKPGKLQTFIAAYEAYGLPIQLEYLGSFLGYFTTEIGELNHVVAWWSVDSLDGRQESRKRMLADERWGEYLAKVADLLDLQTIRILTPTSFSPIR